jgi:hypothetical protein
MSDDTARSPDPVDDPQGYQRHLLGLLGDDDPATVQRAAPAEWRTLVDLAGDHLHTAPADGEWSVHGCLAHAVDAEIVMSGRYRWVLAHDEPEIVGYDQDLWVRRLHADGRPEADELLTLFGALRTANVDLWQRSTDADRARIGMHAERGPESYDLAFRMLAGHDRFHLGQARRALDAVTTG